MKILIEESVVRKWKDALEYSVLKGQAQSDAIASMQSHLDAEIEKAEPVDLDINSMDAAVWAKAFAERFTVWSQAHGVESDTFGLMVGWFANAIMAGYDEATRRHPAPTNTECKCDMRTKLVGDGCSVCNPEYAKDHDDTDSELRAAAQVVVDQWDHADDVSEMDDVMEELREALEK